MYYMCRATFVIKVYILHPYYACRNTCAILVNIFKCITSVEHVYYICISHTCNTPKTPYMYYRCGTTSHV